MSAVDQSYTGFNVRLDGITVEGKPVHLPAEVLATINSFLDPKTMLITLTALGTKKAAGASSSELIRLSYREKSSLTYSELQSYLRSQNLDLSSENFAASLQDNQQLKVTSLDLQNETITYQQLVNIARLCPLLTSIDLSNITMTYGELQNVVQLLPRLTSFDLSAVTISYNQLRDFIDFHPRLTITKLPPTVMSYYQLRTILDKCRSVTYLNLSYTLVSYDELVEFLTFYPTISSFDFYRKEQRLLNDNSVYNNAVSHYSEGITNHQLIELIRKFPTHINSLHLRNDYTPNEFTEIISLLPHLTELHLGFSEGLLSDFSFLAPLTQLRHLYLSGNWTLGNLDFLSTFTRLETLEVENCHALSNINFLNSLPNIRHLNLSGCMHVQDYSPIYSRSNLVYLKLRAVPTLDIELETVPSSLPNLETLCSSLPNLEYFVLPKTSAESIRHLGRLTKLHHIVDLSNEPSVIDESNLRSIFPNRSIERPTDYNKYFLSGYMIGPAPTNTN